MSYLLDRQARRKKILRYTLLLAALAVFLYFRASIFFGLSYFTHLIFRPILVFGDSVGEKLSTAVAYFHSKQSLYRENERLKLELEAKMAETANYSSILDENLKIKEVLGRKDGETRMVLAGILSKPNRSPYDTLIIDVGTEHGIVSGQRVFALGNIPIGSVSFAYPASSKVVLFSSPGEKTEAVLSTKDVFVQLIGRGGGNFEMIMPRDFILEKGVEAVSPGLTPYVLGIVAGIISDPRDAFQKVLLRSPVNIQELKFVTVEK